MAVDDPFDPEPLLLTACRVLSARAEDAAARLLAQAGLQLVHDSDNGGYGGVECLVAKVAIPAETYGQLPHGFRLAHETLLADVLNEVLNNFEGYRVTRVVVVPQMVRVLNWREAFLSGDKLGDETELRPFDFWPKNATPYDILGISRNATDEQVKAAHRRRAFECHVDRNQDREAEAHEAMVRLNNSFDAIIAERAALSNTAPPIDLDAPF